MDSIIYCRYTETQGRLSQFRNDIRKDVVQNVVFGLLVVGLVSPVWESGRSALRGLRKIRAKNLIRTKNVYEINVPGPLVSRVFGSTRCLLGMFREMKSKGSVWSENISESCIRSRDRRCDAWFGAHQYFLKPASFLLIPTLATLLAPSFVDFPLWWWSYVSFLILQYYAFLSSQPSCSFCFIDSCFSFVCWFTANKNFFSINLGRSSTS